MECQRDLRPVRKKWDKLISEIHEYLKTADDLFKEELKCGEMHIKATQREIEIIKIKDDILTKIDEKWDEMDELNRGS